MLAGAVRSLAADKLIAPEVAIGWGESAAAALSATSAAVRLFVLPTGRTGAPLAARETRAARARCCSATTRPRTRWSRSAAWAPTPSSPPAPAPRGRPSAIPAWPRAPPTSRSSASASAATIRPTIPATDPALPAQLHRRARCRRRRSAGARSPGAARWRSDRARCCSRPVRCSATAAPRRSSAASSGWRPSTSSRSSCRAASRGRSSARACWRCGSPAASRCCPGAEPADERFARGAADAILLGDDHDRIGRPPGLALLYGTLPIAPDVGANHDYLVDYDAASRTGQAILYSAATPFEIESGVRRALTLRADGDVWAPLVKSLMTARPAGRPPPLPSSRSPGSTWTERPRPARPFTAARRGYRIREAGDPDAQLTVDVDELALGPDLAADAQRHALPLRADRQHDARRQAQQLFPAKRDSCELRDDLNRRRRQDGRRIRIRICCAHVPLLLPRGPRGQKTHQPGKPCRQRRRQSRRRDLQREGAVPRNVGAERGRRHAVEHDRITNGDAREAARGEPRRRELHLRRHGNAAGAATPRIRRVREPGPVAGRRREPKPPRRHHRLQKKRERRRVPVPRRDGIQAHASAQAV